MAHFNQISPEVLDNLRGRVLKHDETKYWESEFEPYRKYFYPANTSEGKENKAVVDMFNEAWKHHYEHNDHHPEYWVENDIPSKMSTEAALEMICDWIAMSIKFNNRAIDWYTDNKDNIKLHDEYFRCKNLKDIVIFYAGLKIVENKSHIFIFLNSDVGV